MPKILVAALMLVAMTPARLLAGEAVPGSGQGDTGPHLFLSADIEWKAGPASLSPGAKLAVLEGDPSQEGPFVMRLLMPDGFRIQPHVHPKAERVTVISGIYNLGMGEKFDPTAGHAMPAGTFGTWPAGMKHFAWATGETIIQVHGIGPWAIQYVNPADDPRNAKR